MVIPTYWGRKENIGSQKGDLIFDHPTPLDSEETLTRAIESTKILKDQNFKLVIIAAATSPDIEEEAFEKVNDIVSKCNTKLETFLYSYKDINKIHSILETENKKNFMPLVSLSGYSHIRNQCLLVTHILKGDLAILIDDDEVFEDPLFINKAKEFILEEKDGEKILAKAGFYLNEEGGYKVIRENAEWMKHWNKISAMNEAFDLFITKSPRLKVTPFAFGGNLVIHKNLFTKIPFDPNITRGEDIDFLINAKMFKYDIYLDNELSIKHLPPKKPHPTWKQIREDIMRFVFERAKIGSQKEMPNMKLIKEKELDPYPGALLKDDLEKKIINCSKILADLYEKDCDHKNVEEALKNIEIMHECIKKFKNPFKNLISLQKDWGNFMDFIKKFEINVFSFKK